MNHVSIMYVANDAEVRSPSAMLESRRSQKCRVEYCRAWCAMNNSVASYMMINDIQFTRPKANDDKISSLSLMTRRR